MIKKNLKKLVCLSLPAVMSMGSLTTVLANENTSNNDLLNAYNHIMSYAESNGINLDTTYEDFISDYKGQSIQDYEQEFQQILVPSDLNMLSSGNSTYYYNTGYSCPSQANYSKYNLLSVVKKGDIIYEDKGSFGITGHIAIVEGIYKRADGSKYIRLIEAISNTYGGVTRSILDDTRVDEKQVTILRVSSITTSMIDKAVAFCAGEVGSNYKLDVPAKDTSSAETDWYCSELVWAAYKNQGVDIEVGGSHGEPGVTPHDILASERTFTVPYSVK